MTTSAAEAAFEATAYAVASGLEPSQLTAAQLRMLVLHDLVPGISAFNRATAVRLVGDLDFPALQHSLDVVVNHHPALRTRFPSDDGRLSQVGVTDTQVVVQLRRPGGWSTAEAEIERLLLDEARRPFDLRRGPLVRGILVSRSPEEHAFVLVTHEIVCDSWSHDLILAQIGNVYNARCTASAFDMPPLAEPHALISRAQRLSEQEAYWLGQLSDAGTLELPTDGARPAARTYRGSRASFTIRASVVASLEALAKGENAELFDLLVAGFQTVLHRYTGQDDVIVGTATPDSSRTQLGHVVGPLTNNLVLRTDFSGHPSFRQLVGRVRNVVRSAHANQDLPFEHLVHVLARERDESRGPLFQVGVVLEDEVIRPPVAFGDLAVQLTRLDTGGSKHDLTLRFSTRGDAIEATIEYCTDLFTAARMQRLAGHLLTLLDSAIADPDRHIGELDVLTSAERHQLLVEWNDTAVPAGPEQCLNQCFEAQVQRTPNARAVIGPDSQLTYRELNHRANRVARQLRELGVGPDVRVGIFMTRSTDMLAAMLGVLKAGGAYVPLDPAYPADRLAHILADACARVVLTQKPLLGRLPKHSAHVLCIDSADRDAGGEAVLACAASPSDLAYVIYTSGSTGHPKGVAIEHRSTLAFINWARSFFSADELRGVLASTSICFDLSVFEIFVTLSSGGTVILVENALQLPTLGAADQVTLINTVPSAMAELVRQRAIPPRTLTVNLAGEPLPNALAQAIYAASKVQRVYNLYGPTEDTTYTTCALVQRGAKEDPSIGRPIQNTQAYVLDARMQPVPVGVNGVLYLAGAGLAREYLNLPELTEAAFVTNPFADGRMYRTGDLVRYGADGSLEFIGRVDHQVKIRGFRIELGEIEALLRAHPSIEDAVVLAHDYSPNDRGLVAYITTLDETRLTSGELRSFLRGNLPDYMLPRSFVILDRFPLTPNGKIERNALPAPESVQVDVERAILQPRDVVEERLAAIWQDLLKVERVGVTEDFFDLGGHSLLVGPLFTRVHKAFGRDLPLATIFRARTIAHLAELLREPPPSPVSGVRSPSLVRLSAAGERRPPLFCVHGGDGSTLVFHQLVHLMREDQPIYGLEALGLDGRRSPHSHIEEFAAQYVEDIRTVQPHGPYYLAGYCFGGVVAFEMAQQLRRASQEVGLVAMFNAAHPLGVFERRRQLESPVNKLDRRRREFARLDLAQRRIAFEGIVRWRLARAKTISKQWLARVYLNTRMHVPRYLRTEYLLEHTNRVQKRYVPDVYPGKVVLFKGRGLHTDPYLGWRGLAADGVEVYEIPGAHRLNRDMMKEPYVRTVAAHLRQVLREIQQQTVAGKG